LEAANLPVARLTMCGSAAASSNVPQVIADVVGLPVSCVAVSDVSAFGAAIIARKLVDADASLAEIASRWALSRRLVSPGADARKYGGLMEDYFAALN
jgi:sugar (pentulose or hexulose) kinase